jgi:hypothetical protein
MELPLDLAGLRQEGGTCSPDIIVASSDTGRIYHYILQASDRRAVPAALIIS